MSFIKNSPFERKGSILNKTGHPLDVRNSVNTYEDLFKYDTWVAADGDVYIYNGMPVTIKQGDHAGEIYVLHNLNNITDYIASVPADTDNWLSTDNWLKVSFSSIHLQGYTFEEGNIENGEDPNIKYLVLKQEEINEYDEPVESTNSRTDEIRIPIINGVNWRSLGISAISNSGEFDSLNVFRGTESKVIGIQGRGSINVNNSTSTKDRIQVGLYWGKIGHAPAELTRSIIFDAKDDNPITQYMYGNSYEDRESGLVDMMAKLGEMISYKSDDSSTLYQSFTKDLEFNISSKQYSKSFQDTSAIVEGHRVPATQRLMMPAVGAYIKGIDVACRTITGADPSTGRIPTEGQQDELTNYEWRYRLVLTSGSAPDTHTYYAYPSVNLDMQKAGIYKFYINPEGINPEGERDDVSVGYLDARADSFSIALQMQRVSKLDDENVPFNIDGQDVKWINIDWDVWGSTSISETGCIITIDADDPSGQGFINPCVELHLNYQNDDTSRDPLTGLQGQYYEYDYLQDLLDVIKNDIGVTSDRKLNVAVEYTKTDGETGQGTLLQDLVLIFNHDDSNQNIQVDKLRLYPGCDYKLTIEVSEIQDTQPSEEPGEESNE